MIDVPVLVKDALRDGRMKKNYRILVLNDDETTDFVIDNNNLVTESVSIDERMCSGDDIKYGLCEGSSLEFQYFGLENITGRRVQVYVDAYYHQNWYDPVEVVMQFEIAEDQTIKFIFNYTPGGVLPRVDVKVTKKDGTNIYISFNPYMTTFDVDKGDFIEILYIMAAGLPPMMQASVNIAHAIPMGFFYVAKCSRQASTGIIKVTAYNKLRSDYLDAKANDKIIDIVSYGAGSSGSVDVGFILNNLLGDYSIEPKYSIFNTSSLWETSTEVFYYDKKDSNDVMAQLRCSISIPFDSVPADEYFKGWADLDKLYDLVYRKARAYQSEYDTLYIAYLGTGGFEPLHYWIEHYRSFQTLFDINLSGVQSVVIRFSDHPDLGIVETRYINSLRRILITIAMDWQEYTWSTGQRYQDPFSSERKQAATSELRSLFESLSYIQIQKREATEIEKTALTLSAAKALPDVTLRELQSAVFETLAQFGQLSRITDLFSGVELNHERLYPADTLYPATNLYPKGGALSGFKSIYSKLWADEGNIRKWRYLIITYKGLDENNNEADFTLQRTVNADGTDDYNMSDNWLFRNLVWIASDVGDYADAMVTKMQNLTWFPYEMWAAGLPYLETGDEIEIPLNEETYTSYILRRQLKGIQNLQDTYINGVIDIY